MRFHPGYMSVANQIVHTRSAARVTRVQPLGAIIHRYGAGRMSDEEITAMLDLLSRQQALQTQALRAALEGRWTDGADSVAGCLVALDPEATIEPKVPLYE